MDMYPPTAADYAQSSADSAKREIGELKKRIKDLEICVTYLMQRDKQRDK